MLLDPGIRKDSAQRSKSDQVVASNDRAGPVQVEGQVRVAVIQNVKDVSFVFAEKLWVDKPAIEAHWTTLALIDPGGPLVHL